MPESQANNWIVYNTSGQPLELYLENDGLIIVEAHGQANVSEAAAHSPQVQTLARRNIIHLEPAPRAAQLEPLPERAPRPKTRRPRKPPA